ncbi:hypothetical protein U1Q18_044199 [Sarracenia purpurea var. burkii]
MAPKKQGDPISSTMIPLETFTEMLRAANSTVTLPDLPNFDGETSTAEAKEWLRSLDSQAIIGNWTEQQTLEAGRRMLTKTAKSWKIVGKKEDNVIDKWERFSSRVQKDNETITEYVLTKLRYAKEVGASVQESKNAVCMGLRSSDATTYLRIYDYNTAADWFQRIRDFESFKQKPKTTNASNRNSTSSSNTNKATPNGISTNGTASSSTTNNDTTKGTPGQIYCYNCKKKTDHISKNCPEPKRPKFCSICKTEGHSKKECPKAENATEKDPKNVTATVVAGNDKQNNEKYIKTAIINGKSVPKAMIDQGSRVCLITASTAVSLLEPIRKTETRIFGVGQLNVGTAVLGVITASIQIDGVCVDNVEILVVEDAVLPAPCLIGQTWTEHPAVATGL